MSMPLRHGSPPATPIRTAEHLLPSVPAGVGEARALVRADLAAWGHDDLIDDCLIIVSELVTNAVLYGGSAYALRLEDRDGRVYGEVFDPGDGVPRPRSPGPDAPSGRGLRIVAAIADDWGVRAADGGKVVWFSVTAPAPARLAALQVPPPGAEHPRDH
ncbi:ATP-binding protein [Nonomuraea sp. B5E05]|uniref:ATP-binding protein n=1 Tax=Nonomuraea sp. B5E05 TaxID=3153569 RepID=UPI0032604776